MEKGYTLKLTIYQIVIKKTASKDYVTYKDLLKEVTSEADKNTAFSKFNSLFIESFNDKFIKNREETKAIAVQSVNSMPQMNIIDGMLVGGLTGVEQDVYNSSSSKSIGKSISDDEVSTLPYYFKLWMPYDSNHGVLMVQSYTEVSVVSLIDQKIKSFIRGYDYSIATTKHVPKEYKEKFKKKSIVQNLTLLKTEMSESARGALNQLFASFEGLKVEIKISGFNVPINKFWEQVDKNKPIDADLSSFEMNTEENDYDVIATYKDESGRQSQARLSKNFDILPNIILPEDLKENDKQYPDYEKIRKHTDVILEKIKKEIGYTPNDVE